ncbi:SDR family oxidoreductase [Brevundimonas sp.]|uniref:SDR family oxidoreductase n=1 Tax=Brevundimonas sp. TaxID=1871086 RepID=UPI003784F7ED
MRLKNKYALVTAGAQGIGLAIVEAFAREGARVVAADINADALARLEGREGVRPLILDVTDRGAVERLANDFDTFDILVNAAGVVYAGDILACDEEAWARSLDLNVTAAYRTCRALLPGMLDRGAASIINISSIASSVKGIPNRFAYGATKAAVIGLSKAIAADYVGRGIRCNAICPGTIETPSLRQRVAEQAQTQGETFDQVMAAYEARQAVGRLGRPEEVAALAVHLAGDESAFTTGAVHVIDGGWVN